MLTRNLARPAQPEQPRRGWAEDARERLAAAARLRALGHAGVRATGLAGLQRYRTRTRSPSIAHVRPANDNPRPPFRLRIAPAALVGLATIALVAAVLVFAR